MFFKIPEGVETHVFWRVSKVVDDTNKVDISQNCRHFSGVSVGGELLEEDIPVGGDAPYFWSSVLGETSVVGRSLI